jgi:predicted ATPase
MRVTDEPPEVGYPFDIPAVRELGTLSFGKVTVFVGDNGSGKSTLVEALAVVAGFNAEGGSKNLQFETMATESDLSKSRALPAPPTTMCGPSVSGVDSSPTPMAR